MIPILVLLAAYLLGAIPFGYVLVKWKTGADVRSAGSGNIGATNVLRTTGRAAGIATLLLDIAKGYLAVWMAGRLTAHDWLWMSAAALAVMAGHAYSVFLKFKGGKAVGAWTRTISMGSIIMAATLPLAIWLIVHPPLPPIVAAMIAGAFIIYKHSSNIQRLRSGQEHVFSLGARTHAGK